MCSRGWKNLVSPAEKVVGDEDAPGVPAGADLAHVPSLIRGSGPPGSHSRPLPGSTFPKTCVSGSANLV